jgi:hypothetical protein
MTRKVHLHIDRLVLTGVGRIDRASFERRLKASIAEALGPEGAGGLRNLGSASKLDGGRLATPSDPAALGRRIARRITGGGS